MTNREYIGPASEVPLGKARACEVEGTSILIAHVNAGYCGVNTRCPHMGMPLNNGVIDIERGTITCPFHGSKFDLDTGENLDWVVGALGIKAPAWSRKLIALGKPPTPVEAYTIIEDAGELYVETEAADEIVEEHEAEDASPE